MTTADPLDALRAIVASTKALQREIDALTVRSPAKARGLGVHGSSKNHAFGTPAEIFDPLAAEFAFDFDAAATAADAKVDRFIGPDVDALKVEWSDYGRSGWLNPPYGRQLKPFLAKTVDAVSKGVHVVTLTPARPDTGWFQDLILAAAAEVIFVRGRIVFVGAPLDKRGKPMPAPFPSCVSVFDPERLGTGPRLFTWDPASGNPRKAVTHAL